MLYQGNTPIVVATTQHGIQHGVDGNDPITPASIGVAPAYICFTIDLVEGVSELETGKLYFVYE